MSSRKLGTYVVDAENKAQIRRIQLGQSTPSTAVVTNGLAEGELVISEGLQRVRPGQAVSAGPATPPPVQPAPAVAKPVRLYSEFTMGIEGVTVRLAALLTAPPTLFVAVRV